MDHENRNVGHGLMIVSFRQYQQCLSINHLILPKMTDEAGSSLKNGCRKKEYGS